MALGGYRRLPGVACMHQLGTLGVGIKFPASLHGWQGMVSLANTRVVAELMCCVLHAHVHCMLVVSCLMWPGWMYGVQLLRLSS